MENKKVLVITHEMDPYVELTEQAHFARVLPEKIQEKGFEVRVFMPRFGKINERKHRLHEVIRLSGINIPVAGDDNPMIIKVASLPAAKMQVYFVDNEDYFQRKFHLTDKTGKFFEDNDERMIFFNKGAIEILLKLGWVPDIIHCHGWMTSLIPFLGKTVYKNEPAFKNSKVVYTPYTCPFEETLGEQFVGKAHLNGKADEVQELLSNPSCIDLYKVAISYADAVTMGSEDVPDQVKNFVTEKSLPSLGYVNPEAEDFADQYDKFYHQLLEDDQQ